MNENTAQPSFYDANAYVFYFIFKLEGIIVFAANLFENFNENIHRHGGKAEEG